MSSKYILSYINISDQTMGDKAAELAAKAGGILLLL